MRQGFPLPPSNGLGVFVFDGRDGHTYAMRLMIERLDAVLEFPGRELHLTLAGTTDGGIVIYPYRAQDVFTHPAALDSPPAELEP